MLRIRRATGYGLRATGIATVYTGTRTVVLYQVPGTVLYSSVPVYYVTGNFLINYLYRIISKYVTV